MSSHLDFGKLVDQYYGALYRFALSLTQSEADACDLVQETFYIWVRKGSQLREESKVKSWLFTTLHREFLQSRRRETRFPKVEISQAAPELPTTPGIAWSQLDERHLLHSLEQLDETFRAPLVLFYLEDLSYEEIGAALNLPLGTVKSRLSRGVAQLRRLLANDIEAGKGAPDE